MSPDPEQKRILIVDDHPMMREGLAHTINREPDLVVCGEVGTVAQALALVQAHDPDLVLADISLPGRDGVELIKDLRAAHPATPVLAVSSHDESIFAERVLRAGGRGYVTKHEGGREVVRAIRCVLGGQVYFSEKLSGNLLQKFYLGSAAPVSGEHPVVHQLSDREFGDLSAHWPRPLHPDDQRAAPPERQDGGRPPGQHQRKARSANHRGADFLRRYLDGAEPLTPGSAGLGLHRGASPRGDRGRKSAPRFGPSPGRGFNRPPPRSGFPGGP